MSMRAMFTAGSFQNLKLIGKPASPRDAPIVVVAPHSSFFDSIVPISVGAVPCCVLAKVETSTLPFFGSMFLIVINECVCVCKCVRIEC